MPIRRAKADDLESVVAIYNETIASRMVTADTSPVTVEEKRPWFFAHDDNRPLFVFEQQGKVCAWLSYKSFYGRPAYRGTVEISIYVSENARGKGLGRELLKFAEEHAKALGIDTLLAFIFSHNLPSLGLFNRFGYEAWGQLPDIAVMDGKRYSLTILGKKLNGGTI